jgi:hypothetical protein
MLFLRYVLRLLGNGMCTFTSAPTFSSSFYLLLTLSHLTCFVCSIQKGEAIKRMGIVLRVDSDKLKVAYLATFAHARSLRSTGLDPNGIQNWYPITPAPKEGSLDPLNPLVPAKQAIAQWVSLRKSFDVSDKKVSCSHEKLAMH